MKYIILAGFAIIDFQLFAQVDALSGGIFAQSFSKEISEYKSKEYILYEILDLPNKQITSVEIEAITASRSGELTTIIYSCEHQQKRGVVFAFWNQAINEFNTRYNGFAFKHLEFRDAKTLLDSLDAVLASKDGILGTGGTNQNTVYKWDDLTFLFYRAETGTAMIRVFWNGFDSEWNQSNLRTTRRRFQKFFNLSSR